MTRPNITPGDWTQNPKVPRIIHTTAHDPICEVNGMGEIPRQQETANARAIAAVPALLEALESMLDAYAPYHQQTVDHRGGEDSLHSAVRKTRSALIAAGYQF